MNIKKATHPQAVFGLRRLNGEKNSWSATSGLWVMNINAIRVQAVARGMATIQPCCPSNSDARMKMKIAHTGIVIVAQDSLPGRKRLKLIVLISTVGMDNVAVLTIS